MKKKQKEKEKKEKQKAAKESAASDASQGKEDAKPAEGARKKPAYEAVATEVIVEAPRARPSGTVVLRGARILTMNGAEVIENGDIVVKDNRIEDLGRRGQVRIPSGARTIDVALPDVTFSMQTDRGVFSHGRLDTGTAILLRGAPPPPPSGTT